MVTTMPTGHEAPLISEFPGHIAGFRFSSLLFTWSIIPSFPKLSSTLLSESLLSLGFSLVTLTSSQFTSGLLSLFSLLSVGLSQDSSVSSFPFSFHTSYHNMLVTPNFYHPPISLKNQIHISDGVTSPHLKGFSIHCVWMWQHHTPLLPNKITSPTSVTVSGNGNTGISEDRTRICPQLFHS